MIVINYWIELRTIICSVTLVIVGLHQIHVKQRSENKHKLSEIFALKEEKPCQTLLHSHQQLLTHNYIEVSSQSLSTRGRNAAASIIDCGYKEPIWIALLKEKILE